MPKRTSRLMEMAQSAPSERLSWIDRIRAVDPEMAEMIDDAMNRWNRNDPEDWPNGRPHKLAFSKLVRKFVADKGLQFVPSDSSFRRYLDILEEKERE